MQCIDKIEISKFRSFGEDNVIECGKLNVFSGSNDSGKSNIIKALNLFFNERTDIFTGFIPENDFNKWYKDRNARGQRNIIIKIYIRKGAYKDPGGINDGFIAEKIFGIDGSIQTYFYLRNHKVLQHDSAAYKRADSVIRNQIRFIYIPAIRDSDFRRYIQRQLLEITDSGDGRLSEIFRNLKSALDTTFTDFGQELHKYIDINVLSNVNFATLLESMSFSTNEQITIKKIGRGGNIEEKQNIPITNRGDGIQMQFLSFLLWFIANKDKKHKYVWGFEEPEIAYEFQKQFQMSDIFANVFSADAQIFITTHSPAFINFTSNEQKDTYQYRVYKHKDLGHNNRELSVISSLNKYIRTSLFDNSETPIDSLYQDLWGFNFQRLASSLGFILKRSPDYIELEKNCQTLAANIAQIQSEIEARTTELERLKTEEKSNYPDKIFICEDKQGISIWKHLFDEFQIKDIHITSSKGCTNNAIETIFSYKITKERPTYSPKIFRQLDRDAYLPEQVIFIESAITKKFTAFKHYKIAFLPVNEIENFAVISNPLFSNELIKESECFDDIKDACFNTANNNLTKCRKEYTLSEENKNLFNDRAGEMRNAAKRDPVRYLPGKEICKIVHNFSPEKYLRNLSRKDFPDELVQYLQLIKDFFNA